MNLENISKKINKMNCLAMLLIIIAHVVALFSSPFFLSRNYSKRVLIEDYCKKNTNGSSLVISTNINHTMLSYDDILEYKKKNDSEFNTVAGIAIKNATLNSNPCTLIAANKSLLHDNYIEYRIYAFDGWDYLKFENYVYIPESMVSDYVSDPEDIVNVKIDIAINGVMHSFKIGGYYNNSTTGGGWNSRGKYFSSYFDNCIFTNESFVADKYDCLFEMITSDTVDSGSSYDTFLNYVKGNGGVFVQSKYLKENKLLGDIVLLDGKGRNKVLQIITMVVSLIFLAALLCVSISLFSVDHVKLSKRKTHLFLWCLSYFALSCLFVLIVRNKIISFSGFNAYGGNEASLNMILIFFIVFFVIVSIKTLLRYRRDQLRLKALENESDKKTIVFLSKAKFPNDNAFATYLAGIASVYKNNGYDVVCVGNGYSKRNQLFESYFGSYVSLRNNNRSFIFKVLSQLFYEHKVYAYLRDNIEKPLHIFFSCEFSLDFYDKVKDLYSDADVSYSFIVTEEYTKDEFEKYNFLARRALKINHHFLDTYYNENDSFITISKYLSKRIEDKKMKCVYVPFSFNFDYVSSVKKDYYKHKGINYVYCGSPENKDLLPTIIEAFSSLKKRSYINDVHLHIVGVDEEWAIKHGVSSYDKNVISFFGKQKREFISYKYAECDYSVLLRDENKTFAKAGFPTKISESMAFGIVPITNLSSNLSDYLNESNSIIVKGHKVKDFVKAIDVSVEEFKKVSLRKKAAIKTAEKYFNVKTYSKELLSLTKK